MASDEGFLLITAWIDVHAVVMYGDQQFSYGWVQVETLRYVKMFSLVRVWVGMHIE